MKASAAIALLLLAGCAWFGDTAPASTARVVPEAPCDADVPARPVFPADTLTGDEDIFTLGTTLWADRKARKAYELQLEKVAIGCTSQTQ